MSWTSPPSACWPDSVSALLPFVNAEALAAGASRTSRDLMPVVVVALAAGQTIGKLVLFEAASRSAARLAGRAQRPPIRTRTDLPRRLPSMAGLQAASSRLPVVAISALTGLPPLAAVAVAAGTTRTNRSGFAATCFAGRTLRFALIAYGLTFVFVR